MQLKHIEHPEDTIFTGDLSALNWFTTQGKLSLKMWVLSQYSTKSKR